jgi:tRNA (guanine37-N1)-methyltransferase
MKLNHQKKNSILFLKNYEKSRDKLRKISHIKVKKVNAQDLINLIKKHFKNKSIFNKKYEVIEREEYLYFPLSTQLNINKLRLKVKEQIPFEIIFIEGKKNLNYKSQSLEEELENKLPNELLEILPQSYDTIGDIVVVELDQYNSIKYPKEAKKTIANAIIKVNKNVKSVYEKQSKIKGTYRLRKLKYLAGIEKTQTIHKENHCLFKVDLEKVFFSPRLNHERKRISLRNIKKSELIIDLFAGIGAFSITIAKNHDVKIYAFDINPYANKLLKKNIKLNNLKGKIIPFKMNVKNLLNSKNKISDTLKNKADRVIMNLPEKSLDYIDVVCHISKKTGCFLHNYQFCEKPNSVKKAINNLKTELHKFKWRINRINHGEVLKSYSPKFNMIVIDALIIKSNNV